MLPKRIGFIVGVCGMLARGYSAILVNDTWQDGTRTDPAAPTYSENGTDSDADGDLESAWFNTGATMTASTGHLVTTVGTGSASWTTYFTPEGSEISLSGPGDAMKLTWVFTPTGVATSGTSQNFRLAIVNAPSGSRLTADGSPASAAYTGYAMFMNMATTLGNSRPFNLMGRNVASSDLLSTSGNWAPLTNGATSGNHGYDSGTPYTFAITMTRNAAGGLEIAATMSGGTLNGSGTASLTYTDAAPSSFSFDTFAVRPSGSASTASQFDTALFKAEFIPGATPPSISQDPQDQTVLAGQDATFQVLAAGTAPLSYQWYFNTNTSLDGATNSVLTITSAQTTNAGMYSVVVSNSFSSVTSGLAALTVNLPIAPSIITQPQDQTVSPGANVSFSVVAGGSAPFNFQWYFNTNTPIANATGDTLLLTNVQTSDAGTYSVTVSNLADGIASSYAVLTVNTNPLPPIFILQPVSTTALIGGVANFSALAAGSAPLGYQWNKNGAPIPGATSATLNFTNVQFADTGNYSVTATNSVGGTNSSAAVLIVTTNVPVVNSAYNLSGFGRLTTGGGVLPDTDPNYAKVFTATDLANALNNKTVKIIEIMTNLNLGYNEIEAGAKAGSEPFRAHAPAKLHPVLRQTGVSLIDIQKKNGLTIFSANGATIKHGELNVKSSANVIIRNLKFDEMWEWDEASKGNYDGNDWDFIDLGNSGTVTNIWVDHCTFTKAYDGIVDIKDGSYNITISWCKYTGDDGATNTNSWVWQQINSLEAGLTNTMYNFLRANGFSKTDIVTVIQGHDKTHLIGANDKAAINAQHAVTLHHDWFMNPWDRLPRLRAGNVHDYNLFVDDTLGLAAKRLRDARAAAMSSSNANKLNNTYSFNPFLNGSISTEGGALLVEKSVYIDCATPLRNNQTDPSDPTYTGKILGLDTIYQMDNTIVRGNSIDPGNPLGPLQAPLIPFSWNTNPGTPDGQLPYNYTMDDPAQLQAIVTNPTAGAGAGVLTWAKTNWLVTSYAPTAPFIVSQPLDLTVTTGQSATFAVVAGGSANLNYQWYFNTNTPLADATNSTFTINSVQGTNAGVYSVIVTNSAGSITSTNAALTATGESTPPQLSAPLFSNGTFTLTVNGNSGPDYIVQVSTDLVTWVDIFTNHAPTPPFNWSDVNAGDFSLRFYRIQLRP